MMLMIQDLDESIASKLNIFSCVNWYIAHEGKLRAVTAEEAILNVADLMDHDRFDVLRFDPKEMKELLKSDR